MRLSKKFCVRKEAPNGNLVNSEVFLSEAEDVVLKSIFMRIVADKNNLINWHEDLSAGSVSALIEIIPAVDYIPE